MSKRAIGQPWSRPLFRWAGSKRALLSELRSCAPQTFKRYIEPFAGSACLFFALNPKQAILSDFNSELMHAYRVIAKHPRQVMRLAEFLPQEASDYYVIRSFEPDGLSDVERAARFVYLNRLCFNGVYRTDKANRFNVPMGIRAGRPLLEEEVVRCSISLRKCELLTTDFEATLQMAQKGDFVYVDPPYTTSTRATYGEYGYGAFGPLDMQRLVAGLHSASKKGAKVLLSYKVDPDLLCQLAGWSVIHLNVRRQVGGGSTPRQAVEVLASNYSDLQVSNV